MELQARIIQSLGIQSGTSKSGKQWQKGEIIVETPGQYPKKVKLSNMKEAQAFASLPVGYDCKFYVEVSSNEFNGRWYTEVNCYKWEFPQPVQTAPAQPYPQQPQPVQQTYQQTAPYGQQPVQQQLPGMPQPQIQSEMPF